MPPGRKGTGVEIRNGTLRLRFTVDGKRFSETLGMPPTKPNLKHANRIAAEIKNAVENGLFRYQDFFPESKHVPSGSAAVTFAEYAARYQKACQQLSANTQAQYESAINLWRRLLGNDSPMRSHTHSELSAKIGNHPWRSIEHHNNFLIPLRGIFSLWVADDKKNRHNPLEGIVNREKVKGLRTVQRGDSFTLAQEKQLFETFSEFAVDPQVINYFDFAFATGLRPEEEIEMKWTDLFLDVKRPYLYVTRVRSLNQVRPPKNNELRKVELSDRALECLARQAKETKDRPDGYVFSNPLTGLPWNSTASQRETYWNPARRRAGLPAHLTPYSTRHTRASRMLMAGCTPAWCARQLGHSPKMFLETYAEWIEADDSGDELRKVDGGQRGLPAELGPNWDQKEPGQEA